jgi:hypothetical protein
MTLTLRVIWTEFFGSKAHHKDRKRTLSRTGCAFDPYVLENARKNFLNGSEANSYATLQPHIPRTKLTINPRRSCHLQPSKSAACEICSHKQHTSGNAFSLYLIETHAPFTQKENSLVAHYRHKTKGTTCEQNPWFKHAMRGRIRTDLQCRPDGEEN